LSEQCRQRDGRRRDDAAGLIAGQRIERSLWCIDGDTADDA
jgi:hypothetical protein